jgi:hypothetical protein
MYISKQDSCQRNDDISHAIWSVPAEDGGSGILADGKRAIGMATLVETFHIHFRSSVCLQYEHG